MGGYLVRAHPHLGELCKCRLQSAYELGLELTVDLLAGIILLDVAADVRVKQQGVGELIGIHAVAAHRGVKVEPDVAVNNAEGDGVCRAEFIIDYLLGVEIVNALILAGVAAEGKALADELEGVKYRLAEGTGKDAGLGGGVVCKLSGLGADLDDLALLDDYHALPVGDCNTRSVGNDVVAALGV